MNNPYIPPKSENEKIAKRLIEMDVFDFSEEDRLKDTQIYFLQDWLINALDERIDYLSKRLQKEKETGRYQKACHKWFMRWREAKKDARYFDSSLQKQIEATLKLQKDYQELEQKNHAMLVNSLKICNQSEIDNDENERKIAELEYELEKMKCCGNCENGELSAHEEPCLHCQRCFASKDVTDQENVKDNWEAIKEIKEND